MLVCVTTLQHYNIRYKITEPCLRAIGICGGRYYPCASRANSVFQFGSARCGAPSVKGHAGFARVSQVTQPTRTFM